MERESNISKPGVTAMKRVSPLWRRLMQEIDRRVLLHTSPNRATICWLSISVVAVVAALACFAWYAMEVDAKAEHVAKLATTEVHTIKTEVKSVKKEAGYLHDIAATNKARLDRLEKEKR